MGIKFELRVQRGLFFDANLFDPPTACILTESEMMSILRMCKIRNKALYDKLKNELWDKIDKRIREEV
jgi:hypothetical protein